MNGKCKDCKYFDKLTEQEIGLCKRFPPVPTVDRAVETPDPAYWGWPVMHKNDVCGEFIQKEV